MLDVPELERKWFRYRLKKSFPSLVTAVILIISVGAASYLFIANPGLIKDIVEHSSAIAVKTLPEVDTNTSIKDTPAIKISVVEDEQNILKPSLTFMYNIEDQIINYNNTNLIESVSAAESKEEVKETARVEKTEHQVKPVTKTLKQAEKQSIPAAKPPKQTAQTDQQVMSVKEKQSAENRAVKETVPVNKMVLKTKDDMTPEETPKEVLVQIRHNKISDEELNSVINRFEKLKNPALSLFIAKKYYDQGNYQEAYNYALETNRLNPDIEDSVLIFSQSLVKLGKKEEAVATLKAYLNKSNSNEATILLDKIEKGKFK